MTTRRNVLAGLAGSGLAALAGQSRAEGPAEFRIGYQKGGVLVVARQQGAIEKRLASIGIGNVKWVEFQFGPPLLEALGLGSIDIGTVGDTPPIFAQAAGAKVVYVAATPAAQSAILVPQESPLRTLGDLRDKRVAFARGSSSHNLTVQLLAKAGLQYSDIKPLYLAPADAAAAFARGSADAWTIWDPYFAIAQRRQNARVLATSDEVAPSNSFYLANSGFANRHPRVLLTVLDELSRVTAWAAQNRDKLAAAVSEVTGVELAAQQVATGRVVIAQTGVDDTTIARQQEIADTFLELGLIPRRIRVREAVWQPAAS